MKNFINFMSLDIVITNLNTNFYSVAVLYKRPKIYKTFVMLHKRPKVQNTLCCI